MFKRLFLLSLFLCIHFASASGSQIKTEGPAATQTPKEGIGASDIELFATVMAQVQHYYIKPIDYKHLFKLAMQGILEGLDPHSSYLDEETFTALYNQTQGSYAGIGIQLIPEAHILKVISPIDGGPAEKSGIKSGDYIYRVDDFFVQDLGPMEAINRMQGKPGTTLKLTLFRPENKQPFEVKIKRQIIKLDSVKSKLLSPKIGYIRISFFNVSTAAETKTALKNLRKQSPKLEGLIIDVRNNPGGTLGGATDTSDLFLDKKKLKYEGRIVSVEGRSKDLNSVTYATDGDIWNGNPIIVLTNEGSASGSEILAAALLEHNRAITLGTKTFGKGSVQSLIPTTEKTAIKLTTALYYTPKHIAIQAVGVEPEVVVPSMHVPKEEKQSSIMDVIDEANLYGHLKASPKAVQAKNKRLGVDNHKLAHEDFQLFQAVKLMQGLLASYH